MKRLLFLLGLLAMTLMATIRLELRPNTLDEDAMSARIPRPTVATMGAPLPADVAGSGNLAQAWVDTILARPLFALDRRPAATADTRAAPRTLPRLTAILLNGARREVIFAGIDGGRPITVAEGDLLNGFRVQSIEASEVTVVGPEGTRVVRPSFDPHPPSVSPAPVVRPNLLGLTGIPGLPVAR